MNIEIQLGKPYVQKVEHRIEQLQARRVRELQNADRDKLADKVSESEPDAATYVKNLIREDLRE